MLKVTISTISTTKILGDADENQGPSVEMIVLDDGDKTKSKKDTEPVCTRKAIKTKSH